MIPNFNILLIGHGESVLAGLSGGADSVCLLLNLCEMRDAGIISVRAVHCNHGLREEADSDEEFCRRLCERLNVPFFIEKIDVKKYAEENKLSLEEAGRDLRYAAFEKHRGGGLVATAHNKNDNAETVIFNMARGTSLRGICGIPEKRGCIVRPLLNCSRDEIESYLRLKKQDYVTDKTNLIPDVSRNKIRLGIIPSLKEINSAAVENISKLSRAAGIDEDFLSQQARSLFEKAFSGNSLDGKIISEAHDAVAGRAVVFFLEKNNISLSEQLIITILRYNKAGIDTRIVISDNDYLSFKAGRISIVERPYEIPDFSADFHIGENRFPDKTVFAELITMENFKKIENVHRKFTIYALDYDKIKRSLLIRNRRYGDRIQLCGRDFEHRVKKLFERIPFGMKSRMVMLSDEDGPVFIEGFGIAQRVRIDGQTEKVLTITIKEDKNDN